MADSRSHTVRAVLDALDEIRADLTGPVVPWSLLTAVDRLVPSSEVAFVTMDYRRRRFLAQQFLVDGVQGFVGETAAAAQPWWSLAAASGTAADPRLSSTGAVERWTACSTAQQITSWPLHQHYWQGAGDLIWVEFPASAGCTRRLLLWRASLNRFSAGDEALVRLIRPHLFEVDRLAARRRDDARLTAREWQVMELVASGASNAEVATTLVMSVATVRKHMEYIFDRTGVRNRSAAVAALMPSSGSPAGRALLG